MAAKEHVELLPVDDGYITYMSKYELYSRANDSDFVSVMLDWVDGAHACRRGYIEWDLSSIPDIAKIVKVEFRYHMERIAIYDKGFIYAMNNQPSAQPDNNTGNKAIFDDAAIGTAYVSNSDIIPEDGESNNVGGVDGPAWSVDPKSDLEAALMRNWFAFGLKTSEETLYDEDSVYSKKWQYANPKPTLYVEYYPEPPETRVITFDSVPANANVSVTE